METKTKNMDIGKSLRDHYKLVEELSELSTAIMQQLNKPTKDLTAEIIEEIGDVQWRLDRVKSYYNSDLIQEQIDFKRNKQQVKRDGARKADIERKTRIESYRSKIPMYHDKYGKTE